LLSDYLHPEHPCQQEIKHIIATVCCIDESKIILAIDGCSAPVHAMPLYNMALGYARLANLEQLEKQYQQGAHTIFRAMNTHPKMIAGGGGFCSQLLTHTNGKLIGKIGAEGVYCIGVKEKKLSIAVKIESGSMSVLPPVIFHLLKKLHLLNDEELAHLSYYENMDNLNDVILKQN
jgi:L-asparaginase II